MLGKKCTIVTLKYCTKCAISAKATQLSRNYQICKNIYEGIFALTERLTTPNSLAKSQLD